jgi:hypothetical protein
VCIRAASSKTASAADARRSNVVGRMPGVVQAAARRKGAVAGRRSSAASQADATCRAGSSPTT